MTANRLRLHTTNQQEVNNIIDSLKPKTSAGEDEISAKIIKYCKKELITPIVYIINKSVTEGKFPTGLKAAKMYPKFKSGEPTNPSSYRPISLVPTISKIVEKVVLKRLLDHLEAYNLLTPRQHGFTRGKSTTSAIIQLVEVVIDHLENGSLATSILLDLSKAFDCLGHSLIMKKLHCLGVQDTEAKWFNSYLTDRSQFVEITQNIKNTKVKVRSEPLEVKRGVPQGSVLGPTLFILLINDLPNFLHKLCQTILYADDTALILGNKFKEQLDIDTFIAFEMTKQYCSLNDLALNESKTQQLIFTPFRNNLDPLPQLSAMDTTKYLGIIIDNSLSWTPHIDQLIQKLSSCIFVIRRMKQISDTQTARTAYFALFESHLRYGLVAWGGTSAQNIKRVLVVQKRAIRTLSGLNCQESCRNAFKSHKILTIVALYILEAVLYAVSSSQTRLGDQHQYNTRNRQNFLLESHHLSLFERKPSYKGAALFNILPDHLKRLPLTKLKSATTNWLLQHSFYSMDEFLNWRRNI